MSDLDLTPEQWRMARQAGASFTPENTDQEIGETGEQLGFPQLVPQSGELFRNTHTGAIGCIVSSETRRKSWVRIRSDGHTTEVPLHWIGEHWTPCRPDGGPR